ncbi:leucine-rich repeat protein [Candidatus Odyssella acanthamoebae]|uniref:F-box domain-containing protein n=1 Tax=Candidatus Odyssella acanthamoebae TaxID=91604 RepID=A0A077AW31_9PROT|nr:leucine-rich repeat protein [Candidatus Paracaedibacter acanthamoebae]AIK96606.1 hypothetical protein ID47_07555 [Candidatus Paracaedibacter acanthamoebae]
MSLSKVSIYSLLFAAIAGSSFASDTLELFDLPEEMHAGILSFCDYKDVTAFGSTCSQAREQSMDCIYHRLMHSNQNPQDLSSLISILNGNIEILESPSFKDKIPLLVDNNSAIKQILTHIARKNNLTSNSLTRALQDDDDCYKTIYEALFNADLSAEENELQLRNKSILQHLTSHFTVFHRKALSLKEKEGHIIQELHNLKASRGYLSIQEALNHIDTLIDNTFITITDSELFDSNSKTELLKLLHRKNNLNLLLDVGKHFVDHEGTLNITITNLPETITRLTLTNATQNARRIGDSFLCGARKLTQFNTAGLINVTYTGRNFLCNAGSLTQFDTAGLSNVTSIGDGFLCNAGSLTQFDTAGLSNLTYTGHNFLKGARSLTQFDTAGLSNLTSIGHNFLCDARSLTQFDTAGLGNVTSIGYNFLHGAESLTQFDTAGLGNVTSIGKYFFYGATKLTQFDTAGLGNLTSIGHNFFYGATKLTQFDTAGLGNVTSIGDYFLCNAGSLTQFNTAGLGNVISIGRDFLHGTLIKNCDTVRREILERNLTRNQTALSN